MKLVQVTHASRWVGVNIVLILMLLAPSTGHAGDPQPDTKAATTVAPPAPALDSKSQQKAPTAFAAAEPKPVSYWGAGDGKSYLIPFSEAIGFAFLLNQYDRHFLDEQVYGTNFYTFNHNLGNGWAIDNDPFQVNQFLHPYQGNVFHGFARSAGLSFWESMGYAFGGSLLWKEAGETGKPSTNDQITTTFAGSFLGEPLFRIASLLLESGGGNPGYLRELGAAAISPTMGFNRLAFGDRFSSVFRSNEPAVYTRIELGASLNNHVQSNVNVNTDITGPPIAQAFHRGEANADFTISYGLPGKPGYTYSRPFDYFNFEFRASTGNVFENILSRGLLYGKDYAIGDNYRGVWGVYGSYDYIAPQIFRVSTTAASLGTTAQWWLSRSVALQGTALGGVGYGAAGTIHGAGVSAATATAPAGERDYHYGITPQELLAARLILSDRASIDMTARNYYVSRLGGSESTGSENILRADISFTVRVYNLHGITLRYVESSRDARYENRTPTHQSVGTVSLVYSLLGQTRFGAVDWRPAYAGGP